MTTSEGGDGGRDYYHHRGETVPPRIVAPRASALNDFCASRTGTPIGFAKFQRTVDSLGTNEGSQEDMMDAQLERTVCA